MNFTKRNRSVVDMLFILAVFSAFAISAIFVVLFGARIFNRTSESLNANFNRRTAYSYINEKIKCYDEEDLITLSYHDDYPILKLYINGESSKYINYLYCDGESIKEITLPEDIEFNFGDGTVILSVKEFEIQRVKDSLLHIHIVDEYDNISDFYKAVHAVIGEE